MKFIDLSLTLEPNNSEPVPIEIDYISHQEGANILGKPIGITEKEFPDQAALSTEYIRLSTHSGTHIDAPSHYGPECNGNPSKHIDELPLSSFFQPGILLKCDKNPNSPVSLEEIHNELNRLKHTLVENQIVLIYTGADQLWKTKNYFEDFRGVSPDATEWLISQGIQVIGIDSFGFDPPFHKMLTDYERSKDKSMLWPSHMLGRKKPYFQIERLTNLLSIPIQTGFWVACFPIKIKRASAGWSRVVSIIPEDINERKNII